MSLIHVRQHWIAVVLILILAASLRGWLIAEDAISFDSDEAVVGLMARHINQGSPIPALHYGQDYMGSLDTVLIAAAFRVLGESIHTMRIEQSVLYLLALVTAYGLAYELTRSRRIAAMALLLLAVPTMLGTVYTTLALGGHTENVLLGNIVLWLGWQVTVGRREDPWRWAALGLAAGVGWWTYGSIVTACLVVGLLGLRSFSWRHRWCYGLAGAAFLIGSAPWWLYNFRHGWAAFEFLFKGYGLAPGVEPISRGESLVGLLVLGLPTIYGLRFPWQARFVTSLTAGITLLIYLILFTDLLGGWYARLRRRASGTIPHRQARRWVWLVFGVFGAVFVIGSFPDATGRYLMPLWTPAAIGVALGLDHLRRVGWAVAAFALGLLLVFQGGAVICAAHNQPGIQFQLVDRLEIPAKYDKPLLDFLAEHGYTRGYASYWTSYRLIFRSHEAVIFDNSLPYNEHGYSASDNRYPPYVRQVAQADRVVWITQNFPALDALIEKRLAEASITYQTRDFGLYHVYYDFSKRVAPADLGLTSRRPLDELAQE